MVAIAAASACGRGAGTPAERRVAPSREFDFGAHRIQVTAPTNWETLDQGNQKRFRNGEFEIVLEALRPWTSLRPEPSTAPARDLDELFNRGLATLGHDDRREVKERRTVTIDGREAVDIETWSRLDHTNPQRILLVNADGDLLALHTVRMANEESLKAFDSIRHSLHFVSARR